MGMNDRLVKQKLGSSHQREAVMLLTAVVAAVLTVIVTKAWWRRPTTTETDAASKSKSSEQVFIPIHSVRSKLVDASIWKDFEQAANRIRSTNTNKKRLRLSNGDKLLLYGLYKHITAGNAPDAMPPTQSWNIVAEQAKHAAWIKMRDMPIDVAIDHYITAVHHFSPDTNSTSSSPTSQGNDDDDEFETADDHFTGSGVFGPQAVSRPAAVENGGINIEEDENGHNKSGEDSSSSPNVQLLQAAGRNDLAALIELLVTPQKSPTTRSTQTAAATTVVDPNYADESGQTALHLAADKGCTDCVAALIAAGSNVNAADHDGISVLQAAVIAGHVETCRLLLQHGADADQADADGDTPRSCAGDDGDQAMILLFSFEVPLKH